MPGQTRTSVVLPTRTDAPPKIEQAPFYAIQFFPMPRKSMGGVAIDMQARALNEAGDVVPGLYAVGELTGSVGINGNHGMDGMFLGPALITGRIAGRNHRTSRVGRRVTGACHAASAALVGT